MSEQQLAVEIVPTPEPGQKSMFDGTQAPSVDTVDRYRSPKGRSQEIARRLANRGFVIHYVGDFSISGSCSATQFESFFGTRLSEVKKDLPKDASGRSLSGQPFHGEYVMRAPRKGEKWSLPTEDGLDTLLERVYVQHPPIFFADERPIPPFWTDPAFRKFRLRVPGDVAQIMRATPVHRRGIVGRGVRVAMADTGFYQHPYFREHGYDFLAVASPDTSEPTNDTHGHGTGECANLFATAPGINFIGVKMGANAALAIKTAVDLKPHVMTNSWGYSVDVPGPSMPNWLKPLHLAVLDAVARGITVCFSAGNGHYGFPGSMPEVVSVGGVFVSETLQYSATQYTSGFDSTWFPGRRTPDVCGLCGTPPTADYIELPVQAMAVLEKENGWGAFSGTSASSPMVAGVCALLKQADPNLTPADIKNILNYTARDIVTGRNAHARLATRGPDGATGFGLVDALHAIEAVL